MEKSKTQESARLIPPIKSHLIDLLTKVNPEHPMAKKYLEENKAYKENFEKYIASLPKNEAPVLPELKPLELEMFYDNFKAAFKFFQNKDFDETANSFESRKLARTLCAYFLQRKSFYKSPLLNRKSRPDLNKGLMIIGMCGTGKTSILRTFHQMFSYASNHPIGATDIEGTMQLLGRYKLGFGYHTANDLVKVFESISNPDEKEQFWKRYSSGTKYFDDVMTENTASNYGKTEVFKDVLEMRYANSAKTYITLNYAGASIEETLKAIIIKYGERVYDRLFEMFNIIELKGESLRK